MKKTTKIIKSLMFTMILMLGFMVSANAQDEYVGSGGPMIPNSGNPVSIAGANSDSYDPSFIIYTDCPDGQSTLYNLTIDASQVCQGYQLCISVSGCALDQLENFGFNIAPVGGSLPQYVAKTCVSGGTLSYSIPFDLPCNCIYSISVDLVPISTEMVPNCPNGVGSGYVILSTP